MSQTWLLSIPLEPKGKARPRVTKRGTYMPGDYQQWRHDFAALVLTNRLPRCPLGRFAIGLTVGTPKGTMRPDLDNVLAAVLDALQDAEVIENDRNCHEILYVKRAKTGKGYRLDIELHDLEGA